MNDSRASDHADFRRLQDGDEGALDCLIRRWQRPLHAYAWRYLQNDADAADVTAETFVRLHRERRRLRPDTNVAAWLFTTLTRLCHNQHRWWSRHRAVSLDAPETAGAETARLGRALCDAASAPGAALEHEEALAALARAIARLPHDWKTALLLHHYEGWTYREIGDATGCSERGVETRLYRAREQLWRELAPQLREPAPAAAIWSSLRPG